MPHDVQSKRLILIPVFTLLLSANGTLSGAGCTATKENADYSSDNGSSNTASVTAKVNAVGDLVGITAYCYPSCTFVNVTLGAQTATKTSVSGPGISGSPGTGQGAMFYVLSAALSGPQTLTLTVSGSHSDVQTSYIDFSPSTGCSFQHDVDSPLGAYGGSSSDFNEGTITAPAITATAGDLLFNFTWTSEHVDSVNSPWSCPIYSGAGETQTCQIVNTINAAAYILSSTGTVSNNMTDIHNSDSWQALITSFKMTSNTSDPPPNPPTSLSAIGH